MKIIYYLIFLFPFFNIHLSAQNITISNLIALNEIDITESENFLYKLGWKYVDSFKNEDFTYLTFDYKKNNILEGKISKTYGQEVNFVALSFYSKGKKESFIEELTILGASKNDSYIDGDRIVEEFIKDNLEISIYTKPNNEFLLSVTQF